MSHVCAASLSRFLQNVAKDEPQSRFQSARAVRALGKMFGRAGARGWYAARAVSAALARRGTRSGARALS